MQKAADGSIALEARAKLNLTLEVLGRRPDGYHELRTVFQEIALSDEVRLYPCVSLCLECSVPSLGGESNLALRAARLLQDASGVGAGARIVLVKRIQAAGGLAGGSSDAAATLRGLNALWGLGWDMERLAGIAARLGSDVPFFLLGGTALGSGRGEVLMPLPAAPETWVVLLFPPVPEVEGKTRTLYSFITREHYTAGTATRRLCDGLALGKLDASLLYNAFEGVAPRVFHGIGAAQLALKDAGAAPVHLAGSGPTLFGIVASAGEGEVVVRRLEAAGYRCCLTRTARRA